MTNHELGWALIGAGVMLFCVVAGYVLAAIFGEDHDQS